VHLAHGEFPLGEDGEYCLSNEACRADDGDVVSLSHSVLLVLVCMVVADRGPILMFNTRLCRNAALDMTTVRHFRIFPA